MLEKKKDNSLSIVAVMAFILISGVYAYLFYNKTSSGQLNQSAVEINLKKINTSNLDTSLFNDKQFTNLKEDNYPASPEAKKGNRQPFTE